jgi:hypothetical protein
VQLTADGCQDVAELPSTGCCPPPLCGNDLCCTFVAFFQLLPSGPLWDYWKAAAISYFQRNDDPRQCPLLINPDCPSLVLHAIYVVLKLKMYVSDALWPALRESDPMTAVTTLDHWLERLRWEDCFLQACRSRLLGGLTPYEIMSDCGPLFCPPNFPPELVAALKHNIVRALTRANMGVIKNLCGLSWVIEPLGAEVRAVQPYVPAPTPVNWCDPGCPSGMKLMVVAIRDWIEGAGTGDLCEPHPLPRIKACFDRGCDVPAGLPTQIWPGLLAAECIIRSLAANMVCKQDFITLVSPPCFACPVDEPPVPPRTVFWVDITANTTDNDAGSCVAYSGDGSTLVRGASGSPVSLQVDVSHNDGAVFASTLNGFGWVATSMDGNKIAMVHRINDTNDGPDNRIEISTNGGTSWTTHTITGLIYARYVSMSGDGSKLIVGDMYVPMGSGKVFISTDGGLTWTARTPYAFLQGADWIGGAIYSRDGSTIYANPSHGGSAIVKSTNNGATWVNVALSPTDITVSTPPPPDSLTWEGLACSSDGLIVMATESSLDQLWVSTDGGASWTNRTPTGATNFWAAGCGATCMSDDGSIFFVVTDDYIYRSIDHGVTWIKQDQLNMPDPGSGSGCISCTADGMKVIVSAQSVLWLGDFT